MHDVNYISPSIDGMIKRKGGGFIVDKKKRHATPSNTSAIEDSEEAFHDTSHFETAPPAEMTYET